jgi:hypothetical protein
MDLASDLFSFDPQRGNERRDRIKEDLREFEEDALSGYGIVDCNREIHAVNTLTMAFYA